MTTISKPPVSLNSYAQLAHLESYYKNGSSTPTILFGTRLAVLDIAARAFCDFARFMFDAVHSACRLSLDKHTGRFKASFGQALGHLVFGVYCCTVGMLLPSQVVRIMDNSKIQGRGVLHTVAKAFKVTTGVAAAAGFCYGLYLMIEHGAKIRQEGINKCREAETMMKSHPHMSPNLTNDEWLFCKHLVNPVAYRHRNLFNDLLEPRQVTYVSHGI